MTIEERQQTMDTLNENSDPDIFVDPVNTDDGNLTITIGLTDELESKISSMVDTITTGFSCGFG
jgi:predicted nucleotidyltransferase